MQNQINNKKNILRISIILFIVFLCSIPQNSLAQTVAEDDEKNDLYSISMINALMVLGEDYADGDPPNSKKEFKAFVSSLVEVSTEEDDPNELDIREIGVMTEDPDYYAIFVRFYGDPRDLDELIIMGFGEHDGDRITFTMTLEDGFGNCTYTTDVVGEENETIAVSDDEYSAFPYPRNYFDWEEGDTLMIIAIAPIMSKVNPLTSYLLYDFCPNEDIGDDKSTYEGDDIITAFIDDIAGFLFGGFFIGRLSFMVLILLALILGQVLLDRKNKYAHWIGFGFLAFLLYPIFMYTIAIPYTNQITGVDYIAILDIIILLVFAVFILLALFNGLNLLKRYRWAIILGLALLTFKGAVNLILFPSGSINLIIQMFILSALNISVPIALRYSKKYGRNTKEK